MVNFAFAIVNYHIKANTKRNKKNFNFFYLIY